VRTNHEVSKTFIQDHHTHACPIDVDRGSRQDMLQVGESNNFNFFMEVRGKDH
jgi:hypothetical protein